VLLAEYEAWLLALWAKPKGVIWNFSFCRHCIFLSLSSSRCLAC
jgi:hypothetical protein